MTFGPTLPPPPPPGPPAEKRRFSRVQRAVMAGGLAAGLALGGAGISFAASSGSSSSSSTTTPPSTTAPATPKPPGGPGHGPRGFGKGLFGLGAPGQIVHGQATVKTDGGSYKTVAFQVGTATSVGSASITVKSADGWAKTYTVPSTATVDAQRDGLGSVKSGDQVRVTATVSGTTQTAVNIVDMTKMQQSRSGFGFGRAGKPGNAGNAPSAPRPAAAAAAF